MSIKVFKVGDVDWIAAETREQALEYWRENCDDGAAEDPDAYELSKLEMNTFRHRGDDGCQYPEPGITFAEELQLNLQDPEVKAPFHFATTEI